MTTTASRILRTSALAILSTALIAGCSATPSSPNGGKPGPTGSFEELVAAAQSEGTFTYYTSQSPGTVAATVPAFEAKYHIKVDLLRLNSGELQQRLIAEGTNSKADVAELPPEFFNSSSDLFMPLTPNLVPSLANVPKDFVHDVSVATSIAPWVIGYNTELVKSAPTSWEDVINKHPGDYVFSDPRSSDAYMAFVNEFQKSFGDAAVKKLAKNAGQLADSGAAATQQIAAGEFAFTIPNYPGQLAPLIAQGATIKYVVPQQPASGLTMTAGILKNGPHHAAARLFLSWLLSKEGQQLLCDGGIASTILASEAEVKGCIKLPNGWKPYETNIDDQRRNELLNLLGL